MKTFFNEDAYLATCNLSQRPKQNTNTRRKRNETIIREKYHKTTLQRNIEYTCMSHTILYYEFKFNLSFDNTTARD